MDIHSKTEFELNKRLAELMGLEVAEIDDTKCIGMTTAYHKLKPHTVWVSDGKSAWYQFCATRSWEDIGPTITELQIALIPVAHDGRVGTECSELWFSHVFFDGGDEFRSDDVERPEHAATIAAIVALSGTDNF